MFEHTDTLTIYNELIGADLDDSAATVIVRQLQIMREELTSRIDKLESRIYYLARDIK